MSIFAAIYVDEINPFEKEDGEISDSEEEDEKEEGEIFEDEDIPVLQRQKEAVLRAKITIRGILNGTHFK